jgi:hypothetical protein
MTMARTREELVAWLQTRIDESGGQSAVLDLSAIRSELDASAAQLIATVSRHYLFSIGERYTSKWFLTMRGNEPHSAIIPLPLDFQRFIVLKLHHWSIPVDVLYTTESQHFIRQFNPYRKSSVGDPVGVLIPFTESMPLNGISSKQAIQAFPMAEDVNPFMKSQALLRDDGTTELASGNGVGLEIYKDIDLLVGKVPLVSDCVIVRTTAAEAMPENLHDAMTWIAASRCLLSLREGAGSGHCLKMAEIALGKVKAGLTGEEAEGG